MLKDKNKHNKYVRRCKRCKELFRTEAKMGRICSKCSKVNKELYKRISEKQKKTGRTAYYWVNKVRK